MTARSLFMVVLLLGFTTIAIGSSPSDWGGQNSICGETDDRIEARNPFVGRTLKSATDIYPCTASLISNSCMISAGHCLDYLKVVEFNTVLSKDTVIIHSRPEDQYEVDTETIEHEPHLPGTDWAVFKVKKNKVTNLLPGEAQGGYFRVELDAIPEPKQTVEITGYGSDTEPHANYSQQFSFGEIHSVDRESGAIRHKSDTMGGSSGSGMIDAVSGKLIGVHVWGGCYRSTNAGTSVALNPKFKAAVEKCLKE